MGAVLYDGAIGIQSATSLKTEPCPGLEEGGRGIDDVPLTMEPAHVDGSGWERLEVISSTEITKNCRKMDEKKYFMMNKNTIVDYTQDFSKYNAIQCSTYCEKQLNTNIQSTIQFPPHSTHLIVRKKVNPELYWHWDQGDTPSQSPCRVCVCGRGLLLPLCASSAEAISMSTEFCVSKFPRARNRRGGANLTGTVFHLSECVDFLHSPITRGRTWSKGRSSSTCWVRSCVHSFRRKVLAAVRRILTPNL